MMLVSRDRQDSGTFPCGQDRQLQQDEIYWENVSRYYAVLERFHNRTNLHDWHFRRVLKWQSRYRLLVTQSHRYGFCQEVREP